MTAPVDRKDRLRTKSPAEMAARSTSFTNVATLPPFPQQSSRLLIIAYGNPLRRDDGAGLCLAEKMARLWRAESVVVRTISVHQLVPELAADIGNQEWAAVYFVDTAIANTVTPAGSAISLAQIQVRPLSCNRTMISLGHQCDPDLILSIVHGLYARCPPAWLVTVPGVDFRHGAGMSQFVHNLIEDSDGLIYTLLHGHTHTRSSHSA